MTDMNSFGVVGGDRRQIALADSIAADGYTVYVTGFENTEFENDVHQTDFEELCAACANIILPLPVTMDGKCLNMPFCKVPLRLDDAFAERLRHKQVFGGMMSRLYPTSTVWEGIDTWDYYTREEFAVENAVPTSEGAVEIAMREYSGTINGSRCLVAGFGRIGKVLAWALRGLGAQVTVSARKPQDLAWVALYGFTPERTENLCEGCCFDIVFNTIPSMIFNKRVLSKMKRGTIIIDLASAPGGVDFEAAQGYGIRAVQALSLPGKVAPKAAGEIIKNSIYNMMEE